MVLEELNQGISGLSKHLFNLLVLHPCSLVLVWLVLIFLNYYIYNLLINKQISTGLTDEDIALQYMCECAFILTSFSFYCHKNKCYSDLFAIRSLFVDKLKSEKRVE